MHARVLYCNTYWDGPVDGVATLETGELVYFILQEDDPRLVYGLYRMDPESASKEMDSHLFWLKCKAKGTTRAFYSKFPPEKRRNPPCGESNFVWKVELHGGRAALEELAHTFNYLYFTGDDL